MKESIKFNVSCIKPVKTSGSHWIAYKVGALKKLLYKYSIYIIHLQSLCTDKSYLEKERSKFKEYLKQWQSMEILVNIAYYIDVLEPV